jgi:ribose 5-phosphate isomerase A
MTIYDRALELIPPGSTLGLGSGRAAWAFVKRLGERLAEGRMQARGVAASEETAKVAREAGVPLLDASEVDALDVMVDGADEVAPNCDLIKGYGRALFREKVLAAASRRLVILVGEEKLVPRLGSRGRLPVEVVPFALRLCQRRLAEAGFHPNLWMKDGAPGLTDNGNFILDCETGPIPEPAAVESRIRSIPGVVGTGLFLGMAGTVLVGDANFEFLRDMAPAAGG